jgi:hypothetical protein
MLNYTMSLQAVPSAIKIQVVVLSSKLNNDLWASILLGCLKQKSPS